MRRVHRCLTSLILLASCAAFPLYSAGANLEDLHFGEALFHAYQGDHFDAIARLDTELGQYYRIDDPALDSLSLRIGEAEFSVGDFELSYRMHKRAGRAFTTVIEGNVAPDVRNEALYRLARIHFRKGRPAEALEALERISGRTPERIQGEVALLRAQALMAVGRFEDAIDTLMAMQGERSIEGFRRYNLGIALLQAGRLEEGRNQLDRAGRVAGGGPDIEAIRDRSNLVIGKRMLDDSEFDAARKYLNRVRLDGPFSNRALLGSGWTDAELGNYERALVPWTLLAGRNVTDKAVQEALMAVPYAYGQLNVYGKAALLYGHALKSFTQELARLDASIVSIRDGRFLEALLREELKQDRHWVVKLRELPETPETWYLTELMASHDFQESLRNYLDLDELHGKLSAWNVWLDAFEEIVARRKAHYEPLLPDIDRRFRQLDTQIRLRLEQRARLHAQMQSMLETPRADLLATAEERGILEATDKLDNRERGDDHAGGAESSGLEALLRGVVQWRIESGYHERYTQTWLRLRQLDRDIEDLTAAYDAFVRARQAATQSYTGHDETIANLKNRARDAQRRVEILMAIQGRLIETMAIEELEQRRRQVEQYQVQARFAMADSYDRALRTADAGEEAR
jgi:Flp pilus assembly protein TadD